MKNILRWSNKSLLIDRQQPRVTAHQVQNTKEIKTKLLALILFKIFKIVKKDAGLQLINQSPNYLIHIFQTFLTAKFVSNAN